MFQARQLRRMALAAIAALATALISLTHVTASEVPFYWDSINVDIDLQQNGEMWVTETQHYIFKANYTNQRYRYIPLNRIDEIKDVTVTEAGQPLSVTTGTENGQFWIRWQHPLNPPEPHIFVLKYRVIGGLQVGIDNTQVAWKAIFSDRKASIQSAKVTVHLPEALSGRVHDYTTVGVPAISQTIDNRTLEFAARQALQPGDELEIQFRFFSINLNLPQSQWQKSGMNGILLFLSQNFLYILCGLPILAIVLLFLRGMIRDRRCPQCQKLTLTTQSRLLVSPTPYANGKESVIEHCNHCSYHQQFERSISYFGESVGNNDSWSGGDSGSGGGGGDSGGGG